MAIPPLWNGNYSIPSRDRTQTQKSDFLTFILHLISFLWGSSNASTPPRSMATAHTVQNPSKSATASKIEEMLNPRLCHEQAQSACKEAERQIVDMLERGSDKNLTNLQDQLLAAQGEARWAKIFSNEFRNNGAAPTALKITDRGVDISPDELARKERLALYSIDRPDNLLSKAKDAKDKTLKACAVINEAYKKFLESETKAKEGTGAIGLALPPTIQPPASAELNPIAFNEAEPKRFTCKFQGDTISFPINNQLTVTGLKKLIEEEYIKDKDPNFSYTIKVHYRGRTLEEDLRIDELDPQSFYITCERTNRK